MTDTWQDRLIAMEPERETRILLRAVLQRNSMPKLSIFGAQWSPEAFPRFANLGGIDKNGIVHTFCLLDPMDQPRDTTCGTAEEFTATLRRAADRAGLDDLQRRLMFRQVRAWIAVDARAVLNKDDPLSPEAEKKVGL